MPTSEKLKKRMVPLDHGVAQNYTASSINWRSLGALTPIKNQGEDFPTRECPRTRRQPPPPSLRVRVGVTPTSLTEGTRGGRLTAACLLSMTAFVGLSRSPASPPPWLPPSLNHVAFALQASVAPAGRSAPLSSSR